MNPSSNCSKYKYARRGQEVYDNDLGWPFALWKWGCGGQYIPDGVEKVCKVNIIRMCLERLTKIIKIAIIAEKDLHIISIMT